MKFYREALGFRVVLKGKMVAHEGTYVQLRTPTGKQILELNYYPKTSKFFEEYVNGSELDHIGLYVSNVREQYKSNLSVNLQWSRSIKVRGFSPS